MTVYRLILSVLIIFLINEFIIAQSTNPFEIKNRKESKAINLGKYKVNKENNFEIYNTVIDEQIDTANPFEINTKKTESSIKADEVKSSKAQKISNSFKIIDNGKATGSSEFLLWIFLFILVYIAILLTMNRSLVFKIFKAVWFYNLTNNLLRSFLNRDYVFYLLLVFNFIINLATFVYLVFSKFEIYSGFIFWLILVISVFVVYFSKHSLIYLFQKIFSSLKSLTLYNFTIVLFNISIGFILLPLNLIIAYGFDSLSTFIMYFTMVIIAFYFVLRLFRGFLLTYSYLNISIIHYFLYLCTFEILPLLFFYRLLNINL